MEKIYCKNINKKKPRETILILNIIDSTTRKITRDKEGHYMMIKCKFTKKKQIRTYVLTY